MYRFHAIDGVVVFLPQAIIMYQNDKEYEHNY